MPLCVVLQLLDYIAADKINNLLMRVADTPGFESCAIRGRRALEITSLLKLVVEKGMGQHSAGAIAAADARRYFDSLCCVRIALWLLGEGFCELTVALFVRVHSFTERILLVACRSARCSPIAVSVLTGSRFVGQRAGFLSWMRS